MKILKGKEAIKSANKGREKLRLFLCSTSVAKIISPVARRRKEFQVHPVFWGAAGSPQETEMSRCPFLKPI